jgi:hypothetical protein
MFRCGLGVLALGLVLVLPAPAPARELPKDYRPAVDKGLAWLAKQQQGDGHWEAQGGQHPVSLTSLAGLALLMEGSTLREGQYRARLNKAVDWLLARAHPSGLIGNPNEGGKYIFGHGHAMLFLACAVGDLERGPRRNRILAVLEKGASYARSAQTSRGGWGYVSAGEGSDFDEGACTTVMMHGLWAAQLAGVRTSRVALSDARKYLQKATGPAGDILYSLVSLRKAVSPGLTAGAICCAFRAGERDSPQVKAWLSYCSRTIPLTDRRLDQDEFTDFYFAQAIHVLGEDGWRKLFPAAPPANRLTWSRYRKALFDRLKSSQSADGSWRGGNWTAQGVGPVYVTAMNLCVLQLDNNVMPYFGR